MVLSRNLLLWITLIAVGLLVTFFLPDQQNNQPATTEGTKELPDATATNLHMVRVEDGQKTMETTADTLESFESKSETYLTNPDVLLFTLEVPSWNIVSRTATVFSNNEIHFIGDVIVTQLDQTPSMVINTDFLSYSEINQLIETDKPVTAVKGKQRMNAIGMRVNLDTIDPIIHLLSDVNLEYEPS